MKANGKKYNYYNKSKTKKRSNNTAKKNEKIDFMQIDFCVVVIVNEDFFLCLRCLASRR